MASFFRREQPTPPQSNSGYGRIPDHNVASRSPAPPQDWDRRQPTAGQRVVNDKFSTSQSQGGRYVRVYPVWSHPFI